MTNAEDTFADADDFPHQASDNFYETETYWYSFFAPERDLGGWLYTSIRHTAGVTAGGMWIWDRTGPNVSDARFYENFAHLKPSPGRGPGQLKFTTGMTVDVIEPGMSYRLGYDDRDRTKVDLRFDAVEPNVPLRPGAPPYPKASHFDQTGRTVGTVVVDGERIDIDCYAMRDRSWGPRTERGYRRVGYTWAASADLSVLTYTAPDTGDKEHVHAGYVRRDGDVGQIVEGWRIVRRDAEHGWVRELEFEVTDELGRVTSGQAVAGSRLILPASTSICVNSVLHWHIDGVDLHGEDQDVWPYSDWRTYRAAGRRSAG